MSFATEPKADRRADPWTQVKVAGGTYLRLPLHTRWLDETDDLVLALKDSLKLARPGDTVGVSEKVVILLTHRTVDINTVQPSRLARFLAAHVRPRTDSKGLAVAEKMVHALAREVRPRDRTMLRKLWRGYAEDSLPRLDERLATAWKRFLRTKPFW